MASLTRPLLAPSPPPAKFLNSDIYPRNPARITPRRRRRRARALIVESSSGEDSPAKLLTFLGKGGSGKTTASVFAAQHYAMAGLKTCLVIHTQDPTVDYLLNCKIGTSPVKFNQNLSAVRLETTKMLIEPLNRIKQADARLNMTQGVLEGVVGEELGVLPGMDSVFSALTLERLVGLLGNVGQRSNPKERFDIVIYDGLSTEETIRMIGATSRSRLYLKYMRNLAEKTDIGRLAGPSLVRLAEEAIRGGGGSSTLNGKLSSEIWNDLEQILERGTSFFTEPNRFGCYLVMDPNSPTSLSTALRYWGCLIQSGAQISGAFGISPPTEKLKNDFSPLPLAFIPRLLIEPSPDWNEIMLNSTSHNARALLNKNGGLTSSVKFDAANKSVTLFMPGFDKSEIKLYQYRGGSELLVEAGDQRRIVRLPSQIQGKVKGAKFVDRSVIITMR